MDLTNPISTVIPALDGRVLVVLARTRHPLSGRRVADLVPDASRSGVRLALNRLEGNGLVQGEALGNAVFYTANERHLLWPAVQALVEATDDVPRRLRQLIRDEVVSCLGEDDAAVTSVALFGSVARGAATPESDIDVLIVTPRDRDDPQIETLMSHLIDDVTVATGNQCNVYLATRSRVAELVRDKDPMVASWLADAEMICGPDVHPPLGGAPWPE